MMKERSSTSLHETSHLHSLELLTRYYTWFLYTIVASLEMSFVSSHFFFLLLQYLFQVAWLVLGNLPHGGATKSLQVFNLWICHSNHVPCVNKEGQIKIIDTWSPSGVKQYFLWCHKERNQNFFYNCVNKLSLVFTLFLRDLPWGFSGYCFSKTLVLQYKCMSNLGTLQQLRVRVIIFRIIYTVHLT